MKIADRRTPLGAEALERGWITEDDELTEVGRYRLAIKIALDAHTNGKSYRKVTDFLWTFLDQEDKRGH